MTKIRVIHPFLFTLFFVTFLLANNVGEMSLSEIVVPLFILLGVTLAALVALKYLFHSAEKGGLFLSFFLIAFFSYGHIFNLIRDTTILNFEVGRHRYLSVLFVMVLGLIFYFLKKARHPLTKGTNYLNYLSIILVFFSFFQIFSYEISSAKWKMDEAFVLEEENLQGSQGLHHPQRDIYYIILDGYPRKDVLEKNYHFDNSDFIARLEQLGFYVADLSRSNYAMTFMSLASSLNMIYLDDVVARVGKKAQGRKIPEEIYQWSNAHRFLKSQGSKRIVFFQDIFSRIPIQNNVINVSLRMMKPLRPLQVFLFQYECRIHLPLRAGYFIRKDLKKRKKHQHNG